MLKPFGTRSQQQPRHAQGRCAAHSTIADRMECGSGGHQWQTALKAQGLKVCSL